MKLMNSPGTEIQPKQKSHKIICEFHEIHLGSAHEIVFVVISYLRDRPNGSRKIDERVIEETFRKKRGKERKE